jgi:hypothetical protein
MAKYTQYAVTMLAVMLLTSCSKPALTAKQVLDSAYPEYDQAHACWITNTEEQRYCMQLDSEQKVKTSDGERLYILATGVAVDENGEYNGGHLSQGLVGAFVVENRAGKSEIIAANPNIAEGVFGTAPTKWKLVKLGPADYWGWLNTFGDCHQGFCGGFYSILAPYGKSVRDLSNIVANYEDTGACGEDEAICAKTTSEMDSSLKIDATKSDLKVYPLLITVTGKDHGEAVNSSDWTFTFDEQKWAYVTPADYPLAEKDF